jgi:hypothetical protein
MKYHNSLKFHYLIQAVNKEQGILQLTTNL